MTKKVYLEDKTLHNLKTVITNVDPGNLTVRLRETIFHPQGGGQKSDIGTIAHAKVIKVVHAEGGEVDHIVDSLDGLSVLDEVEIKIDPEFRLSNSKLHSGGHMISYAVEELLPGLKAVSGHHWPGEARVVFDGNVSLVPDDFDEKLQAKLDLMIKSAHKINLNGDPYSARKIQFEGGREIPCGGTHLDDCSEIRSISVKSKIKKGQLRISYSI